MSNIDERIVQMKFDNNMFERNVATSISSLEKLKNALNSLVFNANRFRLDLQPLSHGKHL